MDVPYDIKLIRYAMDDPDVDKEEVLECISYFKQKGVANATLLYWENGLNETSNCNTADSYINLLCTLMFAGDKDILTDDNTEAMCVMMGTVNYIWAKYFEFDRSYDNPIITILEATGRINDMKYVLLKTLAIERGINH